VRVTVTFSGILPSLLDKPSSPLIVEAESGCSLADVMRQLDVPASATLAYTVNGRVRPQEHRPQDGDEITAVAPMAGG
jgi:sulfur carrier protein ThiS